MNIHFVVEWELNELMKDYALNYSFSPMARKSFE